MEKDESKLAVYNDPMKFVVKFTAPKFKDIYKTFIIEEKLHKALTFNLKNSFIKSDGELIVGNYTYDNKDKNLRIEIDNPSEGEECNIEITVGANITNLAAVVESNFVVSNIAYIKIKGYEQYGELATKSNLISVQFKSIKIDIKCEDIKEPIPAVNGELINLKASFTTLDTEAHYNIEVKNNLGEYFTLDEIESFVLVDGVKDEYIKFNIADNIVSVNFDNSHKINNKKIDIVICAKIKNSEGINDSMKNEYSISVNGVECCRDYIEMNFVKPIPSLINMIESIE